MVLAPIGAAACSGTAEPATTTEGDAAIDQQQADAAAEAVAIGPVDALPPDALAIAPADAYEEAIAIAPADGPMMIMPMPDAEGTDGPMMIMPMPDAEGFDGPMMIAPAPDAAAEGGAGASCDSDNDCQAELFCEQAICIIACDPSCQAVPCGPNQPCPDGSACQEVNGNDQCVRK
jgi:hypothetical protein